MYIFLSLFLFKFIQMQKIKNKIKTRCPKKEYDAIFEHFYHNIKAYRTCQKICIDQWLGKYFCLFAGIQAKWGLGEQTRFDPITVEESGGNPILGKFCKFYSHLILGPLFPGIKLTKNCYINVNISFSEKLAVLLKTGLTSLSYKHTVLERMSSKFHKIWINEEFKNSSFSDSLLTAYLKKKNNFFIFFISQEKLGSPTRAKFKYPKISLWIRKDLEILKLYC